MEMYEFTSNSWRNLDVIIPDQAYLKCDGHACASLSGNTYWVSWIEKGDNDDYSLLSFDFSTERFQRLCAHFHHQPCRVDTIALSVVREEHLSLFYQSRQTLKVEIWVTVEIETTFVSWSKFLTLDLVSPCLSRSMSFYILDEEKKIVVCCDESENFYYSKLVWIAREGQEYRPSPDKSVFCGIQAAHFQCYRCIPRLFGYVPKD
ncbi:F-box associated domain type 1 [Arabidopsis suecica]|uniref:F-box associated ubiquitination effector family protein n=3 Tax=Arabidopsis TaxID=3701 RepID=F4K7U0_ARATH|nr:F-box associated ubiquitination effector family protein [Arabidopsis thaliana]AED97662.1 F-box associated ubiquitination effector family protein [Arabidopsis thaliana]KAG7613973.1 F-box associated domain type 1 [Arabidopsis suecica]|eukprot:NP_201089.1 F-box associated ubiquitination effector family protein [Arabidopsis thaliana]